MGDGIHAMVEYDKMPRGARRYWDFYRQKPGAPFYQKEFGYYCLDRWYKEGLDENANLSEVFGYDEPGRVDLGALGWCEAGFEPVFEVKQLEDRGVKLYATPGTAAAIARLGVSVTFVPGIDKMLSLVESKQVDFVVYSDAMYDATVEDYIALKKNHVGAGYLTVAFKQLRKIRQFLRKS